MGNLPSHTETTRGWFRNRGEYYEFRMTTRDIDRLLDLARRGDRSAMAALLDEYRPRLETWAQQHIDSVSRRCVSTSETVDRTIQEAQRDLANFQGTGDAELTAWLRAILSRKVGQATGAPLPNPINDVPASSSPEETRHPSRHTAGSPASTVIHQSGESSQFSISPEVPLQHAFPREFGDYLLLEEVGRGGMGVVYKAKQSRMNRIVAVKMILSGRLAAESDVQRFYIEAKAAGKLNHPNVVSIYEADEVDGQHFFSMEFIDGMSLAELARQGPLPAARAAQYVKTISEAVKYAHDKGILHRDLKPSNILIDQAGNPRISDFGLAKSIEEDSGLTASGVALGTPSYMPPEQAAGNVRRISPASDVYSVGAILYAVLTGRAPFQNESVLDTIFDVIHTDPVPPRVINPECDRDLESICLKCLRKDPRRRYGSARELADDLGRFLLGEPIRAKPPGWLSRCWFWCRHIPLVAALTGRHVSRPTPWHKRAHVGLIAFSLVAVSMLALWSLLPDAPREEPVRAHPLPTTIRIASGIPGGRYYEIANSLGDALRRHADRQVEVIRTDGSVENGDLLLSRDADLGLLQTSAIAAGQVAIVAPLYHDVVHVVTRKGRNIPTVADLSDKTISIGAPRSGMQLSAKRILLHCGIDVAGPNIRQVDFMELQADGSLDAAIVTTGFGNSNLVRMLSTGRFDLIEIPDLEQLVDADPEFRQRTIIAGTYESSGTREKVRIPDTNVHTVATTTYLAVRHDPAIGLLVTKSLEALYHQSHLVTRHRLIPMDELEGMNVLALHPAARRFYDAARGGEK